MLAKSEWQICLMQLSAQDKAQEAASCLANDVFPDIVKRLQGESAERYRLARVMLSEWVNRQSKEQKR